ncbi:MAG: CBS domain-containing protein [Egibacteraceae bacterium]
MLIHDIMSRDPVIVCTGSSVLVARRLLKRHAFRHLPVMQDGAVVGIISDRDLIVADGDATAARDSVSEDRRVEEIMTAPVHVISPAASPFEAGLKLRTHKISALPVVNHRGRLVGIVTTDDLLTVLPHRPAEQESAAPQVTRMVPMGRGDERPGRQAESTRGL